MINGGNYHILLQTKGAQYFCLIVMYFFMLTIDNF